MQPTSTTRKPVDQLSVVDLEAFPIWEFITGEEDVVGMDETWVKPVVASEIPSDGFSITCACVLKLNCGLVYPGCMYCDTYAGLSIAAIGLLTTAGRILFERGDHPGLQDRSLKELGLSREQVFPMKFCTRSPLKATGQVALGTFPA